jgi:hypothetical protein
MSNESVLSWVAGKTTSEICEYVESQYREVTRLINRQLAEWKMEVSYLGSRENAASVKLLEKKVEDLRITLGHTMPDQMENWDSRLYHLEEILEEHQSQLEEKKDLA